MKRKVLGKGLDALLPAPASEAGWTELDLEKIHPNAFQPRLRLEPRKLDELAASIAENGVLQPIIVRQTPDGYELVAGERRWRAAQKAGLTHIPAIIHQLSDEKLLELALVENIQREDLSPIEEAHAYQLLLAEFSLSQQELARRLGRSRTALTNTLRLLKLPKQVQQWIINSELSMGQARPLIPLPRHNQLSLAREALSKGLSVRQVERRAQQLQNPSPSAPSTPLRDPNLREAEENLEHHWRTRVEIHRRGGGGQIRLHFHSEEELQRLYERLLSLPQP
ncbi:MAG: ParB/RepB/Spo0J family partition protein [Acidobacteriota bacterium]